MNPGGAFVYWMDAGVAAEQLQGEFVAVAVAAQDLQSLADREDTHFRGVGLGHRREQIGQESIPICSIPPALNRKTQRWVSAIRWDFLLANVSTLLSLVSRLKGWGAGIP